MNDLRLLAASSVLIGSAFAAQSDEEPQMSGTTVTPSPNDHYVLNAYASSSTNYPQPFDFKQPKVNRNQPFYRGLKKYRR